MAVGSGWAARRLFEANSLLLVRKTARQTARVRLITDRLELCRGSLADNGDFEHDLQAPFGQVGLAAKLADTATPIDVRAVASASVTALAAMDESFFRVRFDRLTPKEKKYLRAMAELGEGPHRSGDVAVRYDANVSSLAPTRNSLIAKGTGRVQCLPSACAAAMASTLVSGNRRDSD